MGIQDREYWGEWRKEQDRKAAAKLPLRVMRRPPGGGPPDVSLTFWAGFVIGAAFVVCIGLLVRAFG
jgi:hypothetical protein